MNEENINQIFEQNETISFVEIKNWFRKLDERTLSQQSSQKEMSEKRRRAKVFVVTFIHLGKVYQNEHKIRLRGRFIRKKKCI